MSKRWVWAVPSYLLFWVTGLGLLWWVVVPPLLFASTRRHVGKLRGPRTLIFLGLWLAAVLTVTLVGGFTDPSRAFGAAFAAVVWISAGMLGLVLLNIDTERLYQFVRGAIALGTVQGIVMTAAVLLHSSPLSEVRLPAAAAAGAVGSLGPWATADLAFNDYFGTGIVRSAGLMAESSWSSGYAMLTLIVLVMMRARLCAHGLRTSTWLVAVAANSAALYLTYSRVSLVLAVAAILIYGIYRLFRAGFGQAGAALATVAIFLASVFVLTFADWESYIFEQDSLRPGSSQARTASYLEGVTIAANSGPFGLITGAGAKPYIEELGRGAGSESTYVSLLVRGGLIALMFILVFIIGRMLDAVRNRDGASFLVIIALAVHAVAADLDVGTLTIMFALVPLWRLRAPSGRRAMLEESRERGSPIIAPTDQSLTA